jgi:hypothetical protein
MKPKYYMIYLSDLQDFAKLCKFSKFRIEHTLAGKYIIQSQRVDISEKRELKKFLNKIDYRDIINFATRLSLPNHKRIQHGRCYENN